MFTFIFPYQFKNFRLRTEGDTVAFHKMIDKYISFVAKSFSNLRSIKFVSPIKVLQLFFTRSNKSFGSIRSIFIGQHFFKLCLFIIAAKANFVKKFTNSFMTFYGYMTNRLSVFRSFCEPFGASIFNTKVIETFFSLTKNTIVYTSSLNITSPLFFILNWSENNTTIGVKISLKPALCEVISHNRIISQRYPVIQV